MSKPEYNLLHCVFCTVSFNSYVAVNKLAVANSKKIKGQNDHKSNGNENKGVISQ